MSSEANTQQKNSLGALFGIETKEVVLTNGERYKIFPLKFNELIELEEYCQVPIYDWVNNNPFKKLRAMLYTIYLSLKKNEGFKYTVKELGDMFDMATAQEAGYIMNEILVLSGIRTKAADEKGNVQGAPEA